MLKLILRVPTCMDAELLLTTAAALAIYKAKNHNHYKIKYGDYGDYEEYDETCWSPDFVFTNEKPFTTYDGMTEYTVDGDILDLFLVERLSELQQLIPFEMYFENRGKLAVPEKA